MATFERGYVSARDLPGVFGVLTAFLYDMPPIVPRFVQLAPCSDSGSPCTAKPAPPRLARSQGSRDFW
jgi:hypothetical protein